MRSLGAMLLFLVSSLLFTVKAYAQFPVPTPTPPKPKPYSISMNVGAADPQPSLVGFMFNYGLNEDMRLSGGFGSAKVGNARGTAYGVSFAYFPWKIERKRVLFQMVTGIGLSRFSAEGVELAGMLGTNFVTSADLGIELDVAQTMLGKIGFGFGTNFLLGTTISDRLPVYLRIIWWL